MLSLCYMHGMMDREAAGQTEEEYARYIIFGIENAIGLKYMIRRGLGHASGSILSPIEQPFAGTWPAIPSAGNSSLEDSGSAPLLLRTGSRFLHFLR